jgi:(2Fe-2S) ferredoxin
VGSGLGDAVIETPAAGDPASSLTVRTATGHWFDVRLLAPAAPGRFGALDCTAAIDGVAPLTVPLLADLNARLFGCAVCQQGPVVMLRGGFALYAGVTMASVLAFLQHVVTQLDLLRPLLAGRSAPGGPTTH